MLAQKLKMVLVFRAAHIMCMVRAMKYGLNAKAFQAHYTSCCRNIIGALLYN